MSSSFGKNIKISIFGQSHSVAIGVSIDGIPAGIKIDMVELESFLQRRAPGRSSYSTKRREADKPEILSGLVGGVTCGAPLVAIIRNGDFRSEDYEELRTVPRPSHADFPAHIKYNGFQDVAGGGHFSGRLTAPLCIAGGICLQLLKREKIFIGAHISAVGGISDSRFDPVEVDETEIEKLQSKDFTVIDDKKGREMLAAIENARLEGDSLGGIIECAIIGLPAGIGDPIFEGMENCIASAVFGVPAVKGIEFGNGFGCTTLRGSENNDPFYISENTVKTKTNNHGGILGGISSGMPIIFRTAIKPTPSISLEQESINLKTIENTKLTIKGRHDPCIVPRAVPCIEAAAALAALDRLLESRKINGGKNGAE